MVPVECQLVITGLGAVQRSPNGNGYLVCPTAAGDVVLWLAPDPAPQLRQLQALTLPCRVRLPCLKDPEVAGRYWAPESARLVVVGAASPKLDSPRLDSPRLDSPELDSPELDSAPGTPQNRQPA